MDTSDSEYFESADEDFNDEIEDSKESVRITEKLKSLTLSEENNVTESSSTISNTESKEKVTSLHCRNVETKGNNASVSEVPDFKKHEKSHSKTPTENKIVQDVHLSDDSSGLESRIKKSKEEKNIITKTKEETNFRNLDEECQHIERTTKDKVVFQDVNKIAEVLSIKNEGASVLGTLEDNLWEDDGWEIEEEIDEPSIKQQTLTEKDPLNISTENMWENPEWEELDEPQTVEANMKVETNKQSNTGDSWGSWGSWGVTSLLSTATQSVSTITNQVSQGLSTVLETGMGIPSPEELAKMNHEEAKQVTLENVKESADNTQTNIHENSVGFVLGNFGSLVSGVSNITKFVENTGTKVISGGLETLENIGKKTMEVLQEGDPGLKKKRAFLKLEPEKPILSQVLREAKEKAEQETLDNEYQTDQITKKKVNYEALFDDYHGLVHLEALEMLSKQCELKLRTLCDNCSGDGLIEIQETIDQIKELCELPDEDEDEQLTLTEIKEKLHLAVKDININITYEKLISCWEETESWLENIKTHICSDEELHHQAIETLAQLTALAVEQYHKAGELLLIKDHHSTADEADSLVQLTTTLTSLIGIVAAKFSEKLNLILTSKEELNKENINNLITNVFFEASNSSSYIQDAFQLLIPVLQMGVI